MDWPLAIERNRTALAAIVAGLVAMAGTTAVIERAVRSAIFAILRPAESAVRRLILIASHGVEARAPALRRSASARKPRGKRTPSKLFQLFDSRKRFDLSRVRHCRPHEAPRVLIFYDRFGEPYINPDIARPPEPTDAISAAGLTRRLTAVADALADLPKQAQRMANWKARRAALKEAKFRDPCRPGPPPGFRKKRTREVDELLWECSVLARERERADTS